MSLRNAIMRIIDTHCHLTFFLKENRLDQIVKNAEKQNVAIISSAILPEEYNANLDISTKHANVFTSLGLDALEYDRFETAIERIRDLSSDIIAIGEIGIDHYLVRDHKERDKQELAFRELIALAHELSLPIQVHSRSAGKRAIEILRNTSADNVHMHAFDGKSSIARVASRDYGYYFSIPSSVVRSPQKQKLVRAVDIEHLLVETDSPVLAPIRGEENAPTNVWTALKAVAEILGRNVDELAEIVLENTLRLYKKIGT